MPRKTTSLRKWIAVAACLALGLALAILPVAAGFWEQCRDRLLAAYGEDELAAASGEEAQGPLTYLMTLRRPGITVVVRALASPNVATRELAYGMLSEELARCETAPGPEAGLRLADLAGALAENAGSLSPPSLPRVRHLSMRILALSKDLPGDDHTTLIACCQRVLAACVPPREPPRPSGAALQMVPRHQSGAAQRLAQTSSSGHGPPSNALDFALLAAPKLARADAPGIAVYAEPGLFRPNDAAALVAKATGGHQTGGQQVDLAAYTHVADAPRSEDDALAARQRVRGLDVIDVFSQLNESGPVAAAARAELAARGFSPRQIEVGQHLVSPHAAERLQWAEWLPGIRGVDARFWLLRLSHDPNAEVRRAAVGLLATDRDPEVVRRLQRVVVEETDDRIRDQASRAIEQVDGSY
ncbi:MAG TPA: HEAT repeat domain-containing protein [Pirellulales bacterium]|nr:HEAT repeat domain-containing protein [Pirellulales bacterium]